MKPVSVKKNRLALTTDLYLVFRHEHFEYNFKLCNIVYVA